MCQMWQGMKAGARSLVPSQLFQRFCCYPNLELGKTVRGLSRRVTLNFYMIILAMVWKTNYKGMIKVDRRSMRRLLEKMMVAWSIGITVK